MNINILYIFIAIACVIVVIVGICKKKIPPTNLLEYPLQKKNIRVVSNDPFMRYIHHFISPEECKHLIDIAETRFQRSPAESADTKTTAHPDRTSFSAFLEKGETDIVKSIETRAATLVNVPVSHLESLQVVRYTKGQFFKPHYDYFVRGTAPYGRDGEATQKSLLRGGQRTQSIFIYLNTLPSGKGATIFPKLNLRILPQSRGDAFWWHNMKNGKEDERTLHGGEQVDDIKYGVNIWIRERDFI